jgi:hypothetical protein
MRTRLLTGLLLLTFFASLAAAQAPAPAKPYVIEYYYKVKWGHQDEFLRLFRKNHWPVLKKQMEMGRLLKVEAATPRYHMPEEGRWDYRVTIVYKDAATATQEFDSSGIIAQLYSDKAKLDDECGPHQRRDRRGCRWRALRRPLFLFPAMTARA